MKKHLTPSTVSTPSKAEEIMDVAEGMIRLGGFHAFSFRDVAREVGLKSASVHYHFPTKEDLGAAVMRRYGQRFLDAIGTADDFGPDGWEAFVRRYITVFADNWRKDGRLCLCGMLAAESAMLPTSVTVEVVASVERKIVRTEEAFLKCGWTDDPALARRAAKLVFSSMEGAMMLTVLTGKQENLDEVADIVIRSLHALKNQPLGATSS